ncbi:MAG: hypothetical protein ABI835_12780 [Chloroflexota bacterium]
MAEELTAALRSLANRWAMKARDFARASKDEGVSETQAAHDRGFAEAYYRAATELAELLKEQPSQPGSAQPQAAKPVSSAPSAGASPQRQAQSAAPVPPAPVPAAPAPSSPPAPGYAAMPLREAYAALEYGGCQPQEVTQNKDNSFRATFSSWGKMMLHEQINCVQNADRRIVVLNKGKLESHDYFIEFAFKED